MDQDRIKSLTRSPGATASRRGLGRALAGGALGTLFSSAFGALAVDAKKKRDKKKKKPQSKTVTRTVRQSMTQTFTSAVPIAVPNGAAGTTQGPAGPYPSAIEVSGFSNGAITDVNLILTDFTHSYPRDVNILLSSSDGRRALVMRDVGEEPVTNIDLTLDDEATASLPDNGLVSGVFRPTDFSLPGSPPNPFAAPAPAPDGSVVLSTFDGANPNGTWQLWVMDDTGGDTGDFAGGWSLQITAEADVQVPEQVKAKNKKHRKHGKGRR